MRVERKAGVVRPLQGPAGLWERQAEAIRARLLPRSRAYGFPRLEHLRRVGARYHVNYFWQSAVSRLYPRIHSAVLAFLHSSSARRARPSPIPAANFLTLAGQPARTGDHGETSFAWRLPAYMVFPGVYSLPPRPAAREVKYTPVTPLERLRRYEGMNQEAIEDGVRLNVHRVFRQLQRVEELAPGAPSMVVHKTAPAVLTTSRETGQVSDALSPAPKTWESTHIAPWTRAAEAPRINLDQLTDQVIRQIDNRMIARRERLGKI